jgi:hypothetical protein
MAIRDRDYMRSEPSPSEFPESGEETESSKSKPFDLFGGLPVEQLSNVESLPAKVPTLSVPEKENESRERPNYLMLAIIILIVAIVVAAVALN